MQELAKRFNKVRLMNAASKRTFMTKPSVMTNKAGYAKNLRRALPFISLSATTLYMTKYTNFSNYIQSGVTAGKIY